MKCLATTHALLQKRGAIFTPNISLFPTFFLGIRACEIDFLSPPIVEHILPPPSPLNKSSLSLFSTPRCKEGEKGRRRRKGGHIFPTCAALLLRRGGERDLKTIHDFRGNQVTRLSEREERAKIKFLIFLSPWRRHDANGYLSLFSEEDEGTRKEAN